MKTFLPPKADPLGHAKYGDAVKLELGEAVWVNPLITPGALAHFNCHVSQDEFTISANRSISNAGLKKIFLTFIFVCLVVAGFSYAQGNVLVPMFVALDLAIVCSAIFAVARACTASDSLHIDTRSGKLLVRTIRKGSEAQHVFSLGWVRIHTEGALEARRIYFTASGSCVEIGSFLNHEQRVSLANQLKSFLELAKARALN